LGEKHVELIGHDLADCRRDACADVDLAEFHGDAAAMVDGDECVDKLRSARTAARARLSWSTGGAGRALRESTAR
jgi:hypothetical protein